MSLDDLFPKAQGIPISVRDSIVGALGSYSNSSFLWRRQTGKPFQTLTKTRTKSHIVYDEKGDRYLSESELKRAGSYPSKFVFNSLENAIRIIGNSVPPLFMEAIARHIRTRILTADTVKIL